MNAVTIHFVSSADESVKGMLAALAGAFAPRWPLVVSSDLHAAFSAPPPVTETELLLLLDPDPQEILQAEAALDAQSLPRWGVLILTSDSEPDPSGAAIPPSEWQFSTLARHLRNACQIHTQRRQLARHEGDFRTMARRIRHDLNSPLNAISGMADVIQDLGAETAPDILSFIPPIHEAVDAMVKLIDRIATFSRLAVETPAFATFPMQEPLLAALDRLQLLMRQKDASVRSAPDLPSVHIHAHAPWVELLWQNLVANALQHAGARPVVEIGWKPLPAQRHIRFWVRDHGPGIAAEKQAALFSPFHLLHQEIRAHGLGLALVQRLVSLQDGVCGYEDAPGGGALFHFSLPCG